MSKLNKLLLPIGRKCESILRGLYMWLWVRPGQLIKLLFHPEFYTSPTYYPEYPERLRSHWSQFWNQVGEILRYGRINTLYFLCGYDVMTRSEQKAYVHYNTVMRRRIELNNTPKNNCICILRDKLLFSIFLEGLGLRGGRTVFYTSGGNLYSYATKSAAAPEELSALGNKKLFCKPLDGQCGEGIFILQVKDGKLLVDDKPIDIAGLRERCSGGRYLMQEMVTQHPMMSRLHAQSINTIRLQTVRSLKDGQVYVLPSYLRVGTGESIVDNISRGGLAIGIDLETGYLKRYGFFKPAYGLKVDEHPDSHVRFEEFQIPFFDEAKRQAIYFHSVLPGIHSIGWDIAIGEDGPIFIEGNDNWELYGTQYHEGFRKYFDEYFFE